MKFLSLALVGFLAEAAHSTQPISSEQLNRLLRSGKIDKKSILKHAVPYRPGKTNRKLQEEEGGDAEVEGGAEAEGEEAVAEGQEAVAEGEEAEAAVEDANADEQTDAEAESEQSSNYYTMYGALGKTGITGDYSVSFNSCVSFTVEEDWQNLENYESLAYFIQREQIQSVRNYVLFNVCETLGDCKTPGISEENTYMVDLDTWVTAMIDYLPDQKDLYCQGCMDQEEYCMNQDWWKNAGNIDYTQAAFFYDDVKFQLIDCNQCMIYGCYDENGDAYDQNGWDDVDEWISELAQCQQTQYQFQGVQMNAGFMCNQYGTGLEIGIFMDQECTLYNSQRSYLNVLSDGADDWANYGKSQRVINYLFNYMFDCYGGDMIYVNLFQQVFLDDNGWEYDPCQTNSYTGEVMDQDACDYIVSNNPCYITYDEYGVQNEIDEDECAGFMSVFPCWTMPGSGSGVTEAYQEACEEYRAQYYHKANNACLSLFGQGQNEYNNGENEAYGGAFEATALSKCRYEYANGYGDGAEAGEGQQDQQNEVQYQAMNWTAYLHYDVTYGMIDDATAICNHLDYLFTKGTHMDEQAYDPTISGQMYSYEDLGSESNVYYGWGSDQSSSSSSSSSGSNSTTTNSTTAGSSSSSTNNNVEYKPQDTYFPTMNNMPSSVKNVVNKSRRMSTGAIVATALGTAAGVFLFLLACRRFYRHCTRKDSREVLDTDVDHKKLPLMT